MQRKLLRPARKSNNAEKHELKGEGSGSMATRSMLFESLVLCLFSISTSSIRFVGWSIESLDGLLPRFASSILFSERARLASGTRSHEHRQRNGHKRASTMCLASNFRRGEASYHLEGAISHILPIYRGAIFFSRVKSRISKNCGRHNFTHFSSDTV